MIRAEKAQRIMQLYENDYDSFLDKLKAKRKAKKAAAEQKKSEADKADKTLTEAQAHKKRHLGQKAKDLLDKAGGIEGAKDTIDNVMKYFKREGPSDFDVSVGRQEKGGPAEEKTIMGFSLVAVYAGGAVLILAGLYALSRIMKNKNAQDHIQMPAPAAAEPVLQAAA